MAHFDSMKSPYADPKVVELFRKTKEMETRVSSVKVVKFNEQLETKFRIPISVVD